MGNKQVTDSTGQILPGKGKSSVEVGSNDVNEYRLTFIWTGTTEQPEFLEYKADGILGAANKWIKVPFDPKTRKVTLALPRGSYQSRWAVGEGKWLSPDVRVPGLVAKLLQNPKINMVAKGLNLADLNVCDLPDGNIKTALLKIEDYMPANKWSLKPKVEVEVGLYVDGNLVLTPGEKVQKMAKDKMKDPKFRKQAKKAATKIAVKGIKLAIQQIGIPLDSVIDDITKVFDFDLLNIDLPSIDFDLPQIDIPDVDFGDEGEDKEESVEGKKSWESRFPKASSKIPIKFEWLAPGDDVGVDVFNFSHQDKPKHLKLTKLPPKPPQPEKKMDTKDAKPTEAKDEKPTETKDEKPTEAKDEKPTEGITTTTTVDMSAKEPIAAPEGFYGGWGTQVKLTAGRFGIRHVVDSKKFVKYTKEAKHHDNAFKVIKVSLVQPNVG